MILPHQASLDRLLEEGVLLVRYPSLSAAEADVMLSELVADWGQPHGHDSQARLIWDVRQQHGAPARSQGLDEFVLHTDASFEDPPPRFVGLFVLVEDGQGGGLSQWISSSQVLDRLTSQARQSLRQPYGLRVPAEFRKEVDQLQAPLLSGRDLMRFRGEIVVPPTCPLGLEALTQLQAALQGPCHAQNLPAGTLLLMDNWRTFHGRTAVRDPQRHLKRVRFFGPEGPVTFG